MGWGCEVGGYSTAHNKIDLISGSGAIALRFRLIEIVSVIHNVRDTVQLLYNACQVALYLYHLVGNLVSYNMVYSFLYVLDRNSHLNSML